MRGRLAFGWEWVSGVQEQSGPHPVVRITTGAEAFPLDAAWDDLLSRSPASTVFLTSAWLQAWRETLGRRARVLVTRVFLGERLIGAAAFEDVNGTARFAGRGPSDYADLVIDDALTDEQYAEVAELLLCAVLRGGAGLRDLDLARIPSHSRTLKALDSRPGRLYVTRTAEVEAPIMDMAVVEDRLRKKSLVRHERALERRAPIDCETWTCARDVLPQLEEFFEQHVLRWQNTSAPSLFLDDEKRSFYRAAAKHLAAAGTLRFTSLRQNGALIAAHFGFLHGGIYTWYKPSFDIALARLSPGEVLLKRLLERARAEGASAFDFTIGQEAFKLRFATEIRKVVYVHVTDSAIASLARRARVGARRGLSALRNRST